MWKLFCVGKRVRFAAAVAKEHRADCKLAVEPAASLIDGFANEVGRKLIGELRFAGVRISPLGERHRTAVIPAIDDFSDALHARTLGERRIVGDRIDVGFVDFQVFDEFRVSLLGLCPHFRSLHSRFLDQFVVGSDGLHATGFVGKPRWEAECPNSVSRDNAQSTLL